MRRRLAKWFFGGLALVSFALVFHNFGLSVFPDAQLQIPPEAVQPLPGEKFGYVFPFERSAGDTGTNPRSRTELTENEFTVLARQRNTIEVRTVGGERWTQEKTRVIFNASDNSDPRTNGRRYVLRYPILYTSALGLWSALVFLLSGGALYLLHAPRPTLRSPGAVHRWRWHLWGAALLLVAGLYLNTGTLAPYANTNHPYIDRATGYLYNTDHPHFRVLFDFVDGSERTVWDGAILLRRVLFAVLGWPLMKLLGFETGGTLTSIALNTGAFILGVQLIRRQVGERAAILAAWLLALYPGAAYWGGLPYTYALIFPCSLLLALGLIELTDATGWKFIAISAAMSAAYLGYDLIVYFLPATVLVLAWRRRFLASVTSAVIQATPFILWAFCLSHYFHQPLANNNTAAYGEILHAYAHLTSVARWWSQVSDFAEIGCDVFFGGNFLFLPALFLAVWILNAVTSRIKFSAVEISLLLVALGIFLFANLAPPYPGINLRGTWIARLYQPVFPALVLFIVRWWQHLPPLRWPARLGIWTVLTAAFAGNALIIFGPILFNPYGISEQAFYRFYNHTDTHSLYESNLEQFGRRPLGFPEPQS